MRAKVICAIMVYNGATYHEGEYIEVESDEERQIMMRERCILELPEKKNPSSSASSIKVEGRRK